MVVFGEWAQVESVELVNDGSGLAFGIVGGRSSGVVVKTILPGGVADRDGRLRSGDQLLRIGRVSAVGMCARQAAAVLRLCGARVRLLVARPADAAQSLGASNAPIVASRMLADPDELEAHLVARGYTTPATPPGDSAGGGEGGDGEGGDESTRTARPHETVYIEEHQMMRPVTSIVAVVPTRAISALPAVQFSCGAQSSASLVPSLPLDMALQGHQPETESYEVQLNKDSVYGLGITVAGYVCEQEELSGIFVKSISEGSSADLCGKINVNDRIVEVDGTPLSGVTNHRAVGLLRDARGPAVRLRALRYLRGAGYERLQRALAAQERRAGPPSPSVTSLPKYSFSVYEESTVIDTEPDSEIAPHPPTPASPSSEVEIVLGAPDDTLGEERLREIQDKWREILDNEYDWPGHGDGYDIVAGTIVKERDGGLGISLEGTVRVEHGQEVHARHYIRAVAPSGPVARSGLHRPGDELLEVNGTRLLGVHHVDVVGKLRSLPSQVLLVCARRHSRPGIIDTAQERAAFDTRNILGGSLQNLLMPPQRLIKAKSESSIGSLCSANTTIAAVNSEFLSETPDKNKSRSLETFSGLAMWSDQIDHIDLHKEDRGLGFSILDYLDPSEPGSTVIVVRSVVNGGAAALDGRLAPGDRLVSVNGQDVAKEPLAVAVQAIKSAPKGLVRIGVAKPLPCSSVVGGDKNNERSCSSQKLEYFTKILRLIMSLNRDIRRLNIYHDDSFRTSSDYGDFYKTPKQPMLALVVDSN